MSDTEEPESILNNLSKTRQLWNSKADLGTPAYLIPKTPTSPAATTPKNQLPNGDAPVSVEVVKANEQVVEDYDLPDIKAMRSQWEVPNSDPSVFVPMPNAKSPAAIAREKSIKRDQAPPPEPVNRVEPTPEEETYDVELTKLKAQFESAAKAASKSRPKSPKTMPNHNIKEQVTKNPPARQQSTGTTNKKIRFEDEMTSSNEGYVTEQRTETENLTVNLTGIKSQFESRKDEHLVTPQLSTKKTPVERSGYNRVASTSIHIISNQSGTSSYDNVEVSPRDEPVKSSEPVYDEMVGEESVKDRLKRYRSMTESAQSPGPVVKKAPQKRELPPILKRESVSSDGKSSDSFEVVRSPPAGTRETPDYIPSVDLRHTKALFETTQPEASPRTLSSKRLSQSSSSSASTPRTGRSSTSSSSRESRCSSRHSTTSSRSPSNKRTDSPAPSTGTSSSIPLTSEDAMTEVVKPPPAGTKETPDYVPAVKVSSMKSMFENSKAPSSPPLPVSPPRRQTSKEGWTNSERKEVANQEDTDGKIVNGEKDVVRPELAGTKEKPDYNLSSDFLKSRAAIFNAPPPKQYTPRNKVNTIQDNVPREIVNVEPEQADTDYSLSQSLKDTKKMFEKEGPAPKEISSPRKHPEPVRSPPPPADVVRPPPAGTREDDVIPAANIRSVKNRFETQQEVVEQSSRKKPIDIRIEAAEAQRREKEIATKPAVVQDDEEKNATVENSQEPEVADQEPEPVQQEPVEPRRTHPEPVEPRQTEQKPVEPRQNQLEPVEPQQTAPESAELEQTQPEPEQTRPTPVERKHRQEAEEHEVDEVQDVIEEQQVQEEEMKQDSDTESEGEYVIQKEQVDIQDISSEDAVHEAAAVTPIRVAVPVGSSDDSSSSKNEEQDSLDEAPVAPKLLPEQNAVVENEQKQEKMIQEDQGMSLLERDGHESDEDDFDKPHFHYEYDNDLLAPDVGGSLLIAPDSADLYSSLGNGTPQVDADLLFGFSKSGDNLLLDPLTFDPPTIPSSSGVDLLNGFGEVSTDVTKTELKQELGDPFGVLETNEPQTESDPFDIFGSIPAADSKQDSAPKDPFNLF